MPMDYASELERILAEPGPSQPPDVAMPKLGAPGVIGLIASILGDSYSARAGRVPLGTRTVVGMRQGERDRLQERQDLMYRNQRIDFDRNRSGRMAVAGAREEGRQREEDFAREEAREFERQLREEDAATERRIAQKEEALDSMKTAAAAAGVLHSMPASLRDDRDAIREAMSKHAASATGSAVTPETPRQIEEEKQLYQDMHSLVTGWTDEKGTKMPGLAERLRAGDVTPEQIRAEVRINISPNRGGRGLTAAQRKDLADEFNERVEPILEAFEKEQAQSSQAAPLQGTLFGAREPTREQLLNTSRPPFDIGAILQEILGAAGSVPITRRNVFP